MFELENIVKAISTVEQQIKTKNLNREQIRTLNKQLALSPLEYAKFQQIKSELFAMDVIKLDSAQWIYNKLSHYSDCTLSEKYILYELFVAMLKVKTNLIRGDKLK